jgi:hypothetical protein
VRTFFFAGALAALLTLGAAPQPAAASSPAQVGIYIGPGYYTAYSTYYPSYGYYGYYRPYRYWGYYGRPYRYYSGYRG